MMMDIKLMSVVTGTQSNHNTTHGVATWHTSKVFNTTDRTSD